MEILEEVLDETKPEEEDKKRLNEVSEELIERAKKVASEIEIPVKPRIVGSTARGTWLSEEQDIDLFLMFPGDVSREDLEEKGLWIGKKISKGRGAEQYAEHPYVNTEIDGFDVDIVPCYDITDPTKLKSSVDRSPHHQDYVKGWLTSEQRDSVLILKKFLKGIGAYGSELEVRGFSGYLCELLIIRFDSFEKLVESAKDWGSSEIITLGDERDPEELNKIFQDQPLIVVDPVDPSRNVAAAVSKKNYAKFIRACQDFSKEPRLEFFFPKEPPSSEDKLRRLMEARKSKVFAVSFEIQFDLVPDIIYPQLRKTKRALIQELEDADFRVLRGGVWGKNQAALILLELEVSELPMVEKHLGPPLGVDAAPFIRKHQKSEEKMSGPYIDKDARLVFELEREQREAKKVIQQVMERSEGFGRHVKESVRASGYEILEDEKIVQKSKEIKALKFLGNYLTKTLPWYR